MDKYIPAEIEDKWYEVWQEKGYFKAAETSDKESFSIVIPPPNVTGSLHMGHALNNTLQDILARYKRAKGYNVLWLPGCDHAGIATQNVVERELRKEGKSKHDLGREKFLEMVWAWKEKYGSTIMMQLRKLGSSLDWSRERFTMDEGLSEAVKEVFVRLYKEGLIYRGKYIINWCPRCLTALSDIEVGHKELDGHFYHLRYPYVDDESKFIEVATTRPETMLGDTAVAVHPKDERYKGIPEGTLVILPETGRTIPIIKDEYVDKDFGTGAVKITPAHDPNDFEVGKRHNLEMIDVMFDDGTMNEKAGVDGKYKGQDRFECRKNLTAELEKQGVLVKIEDHKHAVGHCYRCDTVVEPNLSTQWFVETKPLAEKAIEVVKNGEVKFVPDQWEKVYYEWMNNIRDWCISRQLWWGHRIPAWYCDDCDEIIVSKTTPEKCTKCGSTKLTQDEDVLDTWFSSGLWPFSTLGWPEKTKDLETFYPTSVLVTSWDILFFWVARMIMAGTKFMGQIPFHTVVINSLVCDEHGKKMSKSTGNVIDPLDVMKDHSADSLRFTMASLETQTRHIAFSLDRLKGYHNFMNKIWNASKFVIANLDGYIQKDIDVKELRMPEKWILSKLEEVKERVTSDLDKYKFSDVANSMYDFFWHDFCDWYIEIAKVELFKESSEYKSIVQNILAKVLKESMIVLHSVIPFITEEIYQNIPIEGKKESIMLEVWPETNGEFKTQMPEMKDLMELIYNVRKMRGSFEISPAIKAGVFIDLEKDITVIIDENIGIIKALAKVESISYTKDKDYAVVKVSGLGEVGIDKNIIDVEKISDRLNNQKEKINKGIASSEKKLDNDKIPEKVKAVEQEKIDKYKKEIADANEIISMLEKK